MAVCIGIVAGDNYPYEQRSIKGTALFVVPFEFQAHSDYMLYVHARSVGSMQLPMTLWKHTRFTTKFP